MNEANKRFVRVKFSQPYAGAAYVVNVTVDSRGSQGKAWQPMVLRRTKGYVDLVFQNGSEFYDQPCFNLAVYIS